MSATTAADRVRRGAQLLDREIPGWAGRIDLDQLRLSNPCRCIVGQLNGGYAEPYEDGIDALGIDAYADQDVAYGFNVPPDAVDPDCLARMWAELDRLWTAEIRARLGAAGTNGGDM